MVYLYYKLNNNMLTRRKKMEAIKFIKETPIGNFNIEIISINAGERSNTQFKVQINNYIGYNMLGSQNGKNGIKINKCSTKRILGKGFNHDVILGFPADVDEKIMAEIEKINTDRAEQKRLYIENIKNGKIPIKVIYHEGSPLSGHMTSYNEKDKSNEIDKLLKELGLAKDISGWGTIVDADFVKKVGETFTLSQAKKYVQPKIDAIEEKRIKKEKIKNEHQKNALKQAKESGEKVRITSYSIGCTDREEECNLDIVTVWAMPDGNITDTINHTW